MRLSAVKAARDREPFEPSEIQLVDGRAIEVGHPDAPTWGGPESTVLFIVRPSGGWELIDCATIATLPLGGTGRKPEEPDP
jgi:hypothetical protein